ncbi:hypothetical protein [Glutamicibacter sp. X7]
MSTYIELIDGPDAGKMVSREDLRTYDDHDWHYRLTSPNSTTCCETNALSRAPLKFCGTWAAPKS